MSRGFDKGSRLNQPESEKPTFSFTRPRRAPDANVPITDEIPTGSARSRSSSQVSRRSSMGGLRNMFSKPKAPEPVKNVTEPATRTKAQRNAPPVSSEQPRVALSSRSSSRSSTRLPLASRSPTKAVPERSLAQPLKTARFTSRQSLSQSTSLPSLNTQPRLDAQPKSFRKPDVAWDPPPLIRAYRQALKHANLATPTLAAEVVLRLASQKQAPSVIPAPILGVTEGRVAAATRRFDKGRSKPLRPTPGAISRLEWTRNIFVLISSGMLLQYSVEGSTNRLPDRMMQLGKDSVAFACDTIPGKQWVLQVLQAVDEKGASVPAAQSLLSRFSFRSTELKRAASCMLLVLENAMELEHWLTLVRKEIESLGGRKHWTGNEEDSKALDMQDSPFSLGFIVVGAEGTGPATPTATKTMVEEEEPVTPRNRSSFNPSWQLPLTTTSTMVSSPSGASSYPTEDSVSITTGKTSYDNTYRFSFMSSGQRTITSQASSTPTSPSKDESLRIGIATSTNSSPRNGQQRGDPSSTNERRWSVQPPPKKQGDKDPKAQTAKPRPHSAFHRPGKAVLGDAPPQPHRQLAQEVNGDLVAEHSRQTSTSNMQPEWAMSSLRSTSRKGPPKPLVLRAFPSIKATATSNHTSVVEPSSRNNVAQSAQPKPPNSAMFMASSLPRISQAISRGSVTSVYSQASMPHNEGNSAESMSRTEENASGSKDAPASPTQSSSDSAETASIGDLENFALPDTSLLNLRYPRHSPSMQNVMHEPDMEKSIPVQVSRDVSSLGNMLSDQTFPAQEHTTELDVFKPDSETPPLSHHRSNTTSTWLSVSAIENFNFPLPATSVPHIDACPGEGLHNVSNDQAGPTPLTDSSKCTVQGQHEDTSRLKETPRADLDKRLPVLPEPVPQLRSVSVADMTATIPKSNDIPEIELTSGKDTACDSSIRDTDDSVRLTVFEDSAQYLSTSSARISPDSELSSPLQTFVTPPQSPFLPSIAQFAGFEPTKPLTPADKNIVNERFDAHVKADRCSTSAHGLGIMMPLSSNTSRNIAASTRDRPSVKEYVEVQSVPTGRSSFNSPTTVPIPQASNSSRLLKSDLPSPRLTPQLAGFQSPVSSVRTRWDTRGLLPSQLKTAGMLVKQASSPSLTTPPASANSENEQKFPRLRSSLQMMNLNKPKQTSRTISSPISMDEGPHSPRQFTAPRDLPLRESPELPTVRVEEFVSPAPKLSKSTGNIRARAQMFENSSTYPVPSGNIRARAKMFETQNAGSTANMLPLPSRLSTINLSDNSRPKSFRSSTSFPAPVSNRLSTLLPPVARPPLRLTPPSSPARSEYVESPVAALPMKRSNATRKGFSTAISEGPSPMLPLDAEPSKLTESKPSVNAAVAITASSGPRMPLVLPSLQQVRALTGVTNLANRRTERSGTSPATSPEAESSGQITGQFEFASNTQERVVTFEEPVLSLPQLGTPEIEVEPTKIQVPDGIINGQQTMEPVRQSVLSVKSLKSVRSVASSGNDTNQSITSEPLIVLAPEVKDSLDRNALFTSKSEKKKRPISMVPPIRGLRPSRDSTHPTRDSYRPTNRDSLLPSRAGLRESVRLPKSRDSIVFSRATNRDSWYRPGNRGSLLLSPEELAQRFAQEKSIPESIRGSIVNSDEQPSISNMHLPGTADLDAEDFCNLTPLEPPPMEMTRPLFVRRSILPPSLDVFRDSMILAPPVLKDSITADSSPTIPDFNPTSDHVWGAQSPSSPAFTSPRFSLTPAPLRLVSSPAPLALAPLDNNRPTTLRTQRSTLVPASKGQEKEQQHTKNLLVKRSMPDLSRGPPAMPPPSLPLPPLPPMARDQSRVLARMDENSIMHSRAQEVAAWAEDVKRKSRISTVD